MKRNRQSPADKRVSKWQTTKKLDGGSAPLSAAGLPASGAVHLRGGQFAMVGRIESGLEVAIVDDVARAFDLPAAAVRRLAKISSSTFNRRQKTGFLSAEESDRIYRLRAILHRTTDVFEGDEPAARGWLNRAAPALGGVRPIDLLVNEAGFRAVEAVLGRLEYGVFS